MQTRFRTAIDRIQTETVISIVKRHLQAVVRGHTAEVSTMNFVQIRTYLAGAHQRRAGECGRTVPPIHAELPWAAK
jgi:hypothetical protein